eukprot:TRINITY_DN30682_c0_g1_i2.p1 TRINITY_DN30682_c0_g1~~TRINITY_DN30682_c0_g1_i2.p1  ORF type:complete len:518 (-),score=44.22 TRINITY_DN30682_c0_g1_i2:710-2263(-)
MDAPQKFVACLAVQFLTCKAAGYLSPTLDLDSYSISSLVVFSSFVLASLCATALAFSVAGVEFGSPAIPCVFQGPSFILCLVAVGVSTVLQTPDIVGDLAFSVLGMLGMPIQLFISLALRGSNIFVVGVCFFALTFVFMTSVSMNLSDVVASFLLSISFLIAAPTRCVRDQRLIILVGMSASAAMSTPADDPNGVYWLLSIDVLYLIFLFKRRKRILPEALSSCKFTTLAWLRYMRANGLMVTRCQETPQEAFGNVEKAALLLIASHRWLHRYTCDVLLEGSQPPVGFRLHSMMLHLGAAFPETWSEAFQKGFCHGVKASWKTITCGGHDVLLFFDFMALPQTSMTVDGKLVERTREEEEVFSQALPHMGALYSMYEVVVLPEVHAGTHPYLQSGWWFSEFMNAMLSQELSAYSDEAISDYWEATSAASQAAFRRVFEKLGATSIDEADATIFMTHFRSELNQKVFFSEGDRAVVEKIIFGCLTRRLLWDAVRDQDFATFQKMLDQFVNEGLVGIAF